MSIVIIDRAWAAHLSDLAANCIHLYSNESESYSLELCRESSSVARIYSDWATSLSCSTTDNSYDANRLYNYIEGTTKSVGEKAKFELFSLFDIAFHNKEVQFPIKELILKRDDSNDVWKDRFNSLLKYYKENSFDITP